MVEKFLEIIWSERSGGFFQAVNQLSKRQYNRFWLTLGL